MTWWLPLWCPFSGLPEGSSFPGHCAQCSFLLILSALRMTWPTPVAPHILPSLPWQCRHSPAQLLSRAPWWWASYLPACPVNVSHSLYPRVKHRSHLSSSTRSWLFLSAERLTANASALGMRGTQKVSLVLLTTQVRSLLVHFLAILLSFVYTFYPRCFGCGQMGWTPEQVTYLSYLY